ncbi:MAG: alpha/beta hydrolase [Bacteroidota bacterium]
MKKVKCFLFFLGLMTFALSSCNEEEVIMDNPEAETILDVAYANTSSAQVMDIYIPEGEGPFPAVVYIHGGGFFTGDKSAGTTYTDFLVQHGYVAVSINYRLSGEAVFPAAIQDGKAAIRFLRANAATYRIDADHIGSWGDSAGGNLASMLGTSSGDAFTEDFSLGNENFSSKVSATVDWFAPINFSSIVSEANALGLPGFMGGGVNTDLEADYMGLAQIEADPALVALANPSTYIDAEDAAFFIQAGSADELMPYTQSENFYNALLSVLGANKVSYELIPGAGHGGEAFDTESNLQKVLAFFDSHLK